jgi:hypothetical protein
MKRKITEKMRYAVDIPELDSEEWKCVEYFETKQEAIKYAQARFFADKYGKINLISHL